MSVRAALEAAADRYGLPREWLVALGATESGLDLTAVNQTGSDAARGGAWGPTQITAQTARAFGYTGPMENLTRDPVLAAELTAQMVYQGFAEHHGKGYRYGTPQSFEDMIAVWNAGVPFSDLPQDGSTLLSYYPRALEALSEAV
jgi:soluble lytic murein transglycosylase-like protein